jgi:hypothetical protein
VQVGVERHAARAVDVPLLEQRVPDALDDAAVQLALGERGVDDAPRVMDRDDAQHAHDARLGVHLDLHELRADRDHGEFRIGAARAAADDLDVPSWRKISENGRGGRGRRISQGRQTCESRVERCSRGRSSNCAAASSSCILASSAAMRTAGPTLGVVMEPHELPV